MDGRTLHRLGSPAMQWLLGGRYLHHVTRPEADNHAVSGRKAVLGTLQIMSSRERRGDRAARRMRRDQAEAGDTLRTARLRAGLTLAVVGRASGVSASTILRTEQGVGRGPSLEQLARHADTVGLRARLSLYSAADPIRDAPQVRLIRRFLQASGVADLAELEAPVVPIAGTGDRRAFDALLRFTSMQCAVEAFTRFHDCQAQLRDVMLKQRDARVPRLIVVVAAAHANRRAVGAAKDLAQSNFPVGTREVLASLRRGQPPRGNGLIFV